MGRLKDLLIGPPLVTATAASSAVTAAGRVSLAGPPVNGGRRPWGIADPPLLPVEFNGWWPGIDREAAMSVPALQRARDLICTTVGQCPITYWTLNPPDVEQAEPPLSWMMRPDPNRTRQWLLSWTADDLFFYGVAYWYVTDRYATTFPSKFERLCVPELNIATDGKVTYNGEELDPGNIVEFLSPSEGVLTNGSRAIAIALELDDAAERFAAVEIPTGVLEEQPGGEDLTGDELAQEAAKFTIARRSNTTAATNKYLKYREIQNNPETMQLTAGRGYQALEMSRLGNIPPYLVGAPAGTGMTYQNTAQATADLISFGALPYIGCIEQTLGGPNVTPRGTTVRLDVNALLRNPFTEAQPAANDLQQAFNEPQPTPDPTAP
jgi:Phage portal protein